MSAHARDTGPGIGQMLAAGVRALRSYPGLTATLYGVQFLLSAVAAWIMASALAAAFARQPLFDRAVEGDRLAQFLLLRDNPSLALALVAVGVGAAVIYAAVSWFLAGGLNATLIERPTGRRLVAERFGAGGAATFFAYARLWLFCLLPYGVATAVLVVGVGYALDDLRRALSLGEALGILAPTILPAVLLAWVTATAAAYARIDLTRSGQGAAHRALLHGYRLVATRPRALAHALLYCVVWLAITLLLAVVTADQPMLGAAGALWLFFLRQVTAALRFAAKLALIGGQVELARGLEP
jgi:hypothetical protein